MRRILSLLLASTAACISVPDRFQGQYALDPALSAASHASFAPDEPVIVLSERRRVKYLRGGNGPTGFEENIYRALLIRRTDALDHGTVTLPYSREDILYLTAVTRLPDGKVVQFDPATILTVPRYRGAGEEAKTRHASVLPFPEVKAGAIIELSFSVKKADWQPISGLEMDPDLPVRHAEIAVLYPHELDFTRRTSPGTWSTESKSENGAYSSYVYTLKDYTPPREAAFRAQRDRLSVALLWSSLYGGRVTYFDGWTLAAGFGWKEWTDLAKLEKPPEIELAKDEPREKAEAIVRWVEEKILDRASGYEPKADLRSAAQIIESRLGTANDRALVIFALLRAQKLEPELAVLDLDGRDISNQPRPLMFDRDALLILLRLGKEELWIDPACLTCAVGEVHPLRQHRPAIVLFAERQPEILKDYRSGGTLPESLPKVRVNPMKTPTEKERGLVSENYQLKLTPRGLLVTEGKIEYRGSDAAEIRYWNQERASSKTKEQAKKYVDGWADGDVSVTVTPDRATMKLSDVLLARSGFVQAGPYVVLDLAQVFTEKWLNAAKRTRKEPLRFNGKRGFDRTVELTLPSGMKASAIPEGKQLEIPEGRYEISIEIKGDKCVMREHLDLDQVDVQPNHHPKLREFLDQVIKARRRPVVLVQK